MLLAEPAPDQGGWCGRTIDRRTLKSGDTVVLFKEKKKEVCVLAHGEAWGS